MREACALVGHCHPNINTVLGTCSPPQESGELSDHPVMIFPHLNQGNLKHFLQQPKSCSRGTGQVNQFDYSFNSNIEHTVRRFFLLTREKNQSSYVQIFGHTRREFFVLLVSP